MKVRKIPVVVDALSVSSIIDKVPEALSELAIWIADSPERVTSVDLLADGVIVHTLEGDMRAEVGDWLIRGVHKELYPCKPDIFEKTYELVE